MIIEHPVWEDIPALRALWKQAFGDTDAYLDSFFSRAFSPERALTAKENNKVVGALYWLDCLWGEKKLSYIYAVATDKDHRGRGVCKALMTEAHREMAQAGKEHFLSRQMTACGHFTTGWAIGILAVWRKRPALPGTHLWH